MGLRKSRRPRTVKSAAASTASASVPLQQSEDSQHWEENEGSLFGSTMNDVNPSTVSEIDFGGRRNLSQGRGGGRQVNSMVSSVPSVPKKVIKPFIPPQLVLDGFNRTHSTEPENRNRPSTPGQLDLASKTPSTNYQKMTEMSINERIQDRIRERSHGGSSNTSPNLPNNYNNNRASSIKSVSKLLPSDDLAHINRSPPATSSNTTNINNSNTNTSNTNNNSAGKIYGKVKAHSSTLPLETSMLMQKAAAAEEYSLRPRGRNTNYPYSVPPNRHNTNNTTYISNTTFNPTSATSSTAYRNTNTTSTAHTTHHTANNAEGESTQQLDKDIFALYGALPNFTDPQKRLMFSKTEDRIPVHSIYLGIYRFASTSSNSSGGTSGTSTNSTNTSTPAGARPLYLRVDGSTNQCILLGLNRDSDYSNKQGNLRTEPLEIEEIPFDQVKKIMCGPAHLDKPHSSLHFIALSVHNTLTLRNVGVGPGCMLCPTMSTSKQDSAKYVLVLVDQQGLEVFRRHVAALPVYHKKKNPREWLQYNPSYSESLLKDYLCAHMHRDMHSLDELRDRAARELETKQKNERRRNRSNRLQGTGAVDPRDSETYAPCTVQAPAAGPSSSSTAVKVRALHPQRTVGMFQPYTFLPPTSSLPPPQLQPPSQALLPISLLDPTTKRDRDIVQIQNTLRDSAAFGLSKTDVKRLKDRLVALLMVE